MTEHTTKGLAERLNEVDAIALDLQKTFAQISVQHQKNGGFIEYLYLNHFLEESIDISYLFQHILKNKNTIRFLAIGNRMLLEVLLKSEHIIRLKNKGDDNMILSLASKDMVSMMSALNEAIDSQEKTPTDKTLIKLSIVNKITKTDFDLNKIKPNTPTFPKAKELCNQSKLCIKDYCGAKLWHYYALWSWNNHSRIGDKFATEKNADYILNNHVECFIEMYLKTIKLLSTHANDFEVEKRANEFMVEIRVPYP